MSDKSSKINDLQKDWETLAAEDALWAILSRPEKDRNRWQIEDFFATGKETIDTYMVLMRQAGVSENFKNALDFGCGVGRLTKAWLNFSSESSGVDISEQMIGLAKQFHKDNASLHFHHNPSSDLRIFQDGQFDLVFSHICLQHIPFSLVKGYIGEFSRICQKQGIVVFQLPETPASSQFFARIRKFLVDSLPFGLAQAYRRRKYNRSVLFDMHFTPRHTVEKIAKSHGLHLLKFIPQEQAGELEGAIYIFRKQ